MTNNNVKWSRTRTALRELLNHFRCSKCKKSLHTPQQFLNCGHVSCISCINTSNDTCIDCLLDEKIIDFVKDETIRKILHACCTIAKEIGYAINDENVDVKIQHVPLNDVDNNINVNDGKLDYKGAIYNKSSKKLSKKFRKRKKNSSSNYVSKKPKIDKLSAVLINPSRINKQCPKGQTILLRECQKNRQDRVKALLEAGADPNISCYANWTPLQESVDFHFYEIADLLLQHGADVNKIGHSGRTALHEAAKNNNLKIIKLLLSYGARNDVIDNDGKPPSFYCQLEEIKSLLLVDKNPQLENSVVQNNSETFIEDQYNVPSTSRNNRRKNFQSLIEEENNICVESRLNDNYQLNSSEQLAIVFEKVSSMNISAESPKEDVFQCDSMQSPQEEKFNTNNNDHFVSPSLSEEKTINNKQISNNLNWKKFFASEITHDSNAINKPCTISNLTHNNKKKLEKFNAILCNPKRINKRSPKGETLLLQECRKNHVDIVKALLDAGADPNIPCYADWTPLQESVDYGYYEMTEVLLKSGAEVNKIGHKGRTALHEAVANNNLKIINLLMSCGAKKDILDKSGQTPVSLCLTREAKSFLNIDSDQNIQNDCANDIISILGEKIIEDPSTSKKNISINNRLSPKKEDKKLLLERHVEKINKTSQEPVNVVEEVNSNGQSIAPSKEDMIDRIFVEKPDSASFHDKVDKIRASPSFSNGKSQIDVGDSNNQFNHVSSQESVIILNSHESSAFNYQHDDVDLSQSTQNDTITIDSEEIIDVEN